MRKFTIALAMLLFMQTSMFAQFPYTFSTSTDTYSELEGAFLMSGLDTWDDPQIRLPLGFFFDLAGESTNTLYIEDYFTGAFITADTSETGSHPVFAIYGDDIADRGYEANMPQSQIYYKIEGTPNTRIVKVEWRNVGFIEEQNEVTVGPSYVNFQAWFYEGSNIIEVRFGPSDIVAENMVHDFNGAFVGLLNPFDYNSYMFNAWFLSGDAANPTVESGTQNDIYSITALTSEPVDGTVYTFTPIQSSVNDLEEEKTVFTINPTIAKDIITLNWSKDLGVDYSLQITDSYGRTVREEVSTTNNYVDVADLASGVYFLSVMINNEISTQKFVKQ